MDHSLPFPDHIEWRVDAAPVELGEGVQCRVMPQRVSGTQTSTSASTGSPATLESKRPTAPVERTGAWSDKKDRVWVLPQTTTLASGFVVNESVCHSAAPGLEEKVHGAFD